MSMDDGTTIPSLDFSMTSCSFEFQCDVNLTLIFPMIYFLIELQVGLITIRLESDNFK